MKNNLWISILLALLVSGCSQKEEFNNQNVAPEGRVFTTSFENNQSRTFVKDGYLSCWTADDRISLFDGNTLNLQYKFYGKTGDNGGTFLMDSKPEGTGSSLTTNYAVYPYSENVKITTDGVITVNLPSEQHYAENSFGLGDNTMVAVTQDIHDTFLNFKNVGGCLKLQLYGNDATIQTITFTGNNKEKIAGKAILSVYCSSMGGKNTSAKSAWGGSDVPQRTGTAFRPQILHPDPPPGHRCRQRQTVPLPGKQGGKDRPNDPSAGRRADPRRGNGAFPQSPPTGWDLFRQRRRSWLRQSPRRHGCFDG